MKLKIGRMVGLIIMGLGVNLQHMFIGNGALWGVMAGCILVLTSK